MFSWYQSLKLNSTLYLHGQLSLLLLRHSPPHAFPNPHGLHLEEHTIPPPLKFLMSNIKNIVHTSLQPDNYPIWRLQIVKLFTANKFDGYLTGSIPCPPKHLLSPSDDLTPNPAFHTWHLLDQNLAAALYSTISSSILPHILTLTTCQDIWTTLEKCLQPTNRSRVIQLKNELHNASMKDLTMTQYLAHIKSLVDNITAAESAIVASRDSSVDSESSPRFTCSNCDAMSGSDSSSSGKYRSSSELQSIGNTIIQASGASFLTYSLFTGILGTTEMTRHTSVGIKSALPSFSVSLILSPDIKSASLMGYLIGTFYHQFLYSVLGVLLRPENFVLRDLPIFGPHLSPHLSPHVSEGDIFIIKEILFNFPFLSSWGVITSAGSGASLVLVLVLLLGMWLPISIIFTIIIFSFNMPYHIYDLHIYGVVQLFLFIFHIILIFQIFFFPFHIFFLFLFWYPDLLAMAPLNLWFLIWEEYFFDLWATIEVGFFLRRSQRTTRSLREFSKVSTVRTSVIMGFLLDPFLMLLIGGGGSPGSYTGCHAQIHFSFFSLIISSRPWPPDLFSLPPGPFDSGSLNHWFKCHTPMFTVWFSKLGRLRQTKIQDGRSFNGLKFLGKFWKADGIVDKTLPRDFTLILRGLYDLSSGFDTIGEHTGAGHNHNIVMPFGGESPGSEGPES
ncbi:hypothetical protein M5K25_002541 [Dendrobium thyrsiflorum]|uniref:Retrotransposon Copia-like N-terminal domain-containing protein n=1 Tax=Dendrobium thyrsiflorum TaxID=117978 RepID=A0ABD0VV45_DENTH